jgi:hypothetical protein
MAVTLPEQTGTAFAVYISIFEALGWALFSLGAGFLGEALGPKAVFLWVLVLLMVLNDAFLALLHAPATATTWPGCSGNWTRAAPPPSPDRRTVLVDAAALGSPRGGVGSPVIEPATIRTGSPWG